MAATKNKPPSPARPRLVLRRADQAVAAGIMTASLVAIGGWWVWQGRLAGRLIDIERAELIAIDFKIDVNQADWPEFALLPNIGERLAKQIVAERQERGKFRDLAELRQVRGIGPKTLESIKPFLSPIPDLETTADHQADQSHLPRPPARVN